MSTESNYVSYLMDRILDEVTSTEHSSSTGQDNPQKTAMSSSNIQVNEVGPLSSDTTQSRMHSQSISHPEIYSAFPQSSIFQQPPVYIGPPQTASMPLLNMPSTSCGRSSLNQTKSKKWFSPPHQPPEVYPVGPPIPAGAIPQLNHTTVDFDSSLLKPSQQSSGPSESTDSQPGPSINPFIHFDPLNPLHNSMALHKFLPNSAVKGLYTENSSGTEGCHSLNPLEKEGPDSLNSTVKDGQLSNPQTHTFRTDRTGGKGLSQTYESNMLQIENTSHVDLVGDTMYIRTDINNDSTVNASEEEEGESHSCSQCFLVFNSVSELAMHLKNKHYEKKLSKSKKRTDFSVSEHLNLFRCEICGGEFFFDSDLLNHHVTVHVPFIKERLETGDDQNSENTDLQRAEGLTDKLASELGGKSFPENLNKDKNKKKESEKFQESNTEHESGMANDENSYLSTGSAEIQIKYGNRKDSDFDNASCLDTDYENVFLCSICSEITLSEPEFRAHMKEKHNEQWNASARETFLNTDQSELWKCEVCGGKYFFESDLKEHQARIHQFMDISNNSNESNKTELLLKLTLAGKKRERMAGRRRREKLWMPPDYIYYGTGTRVVGESSKAAQNYMAGGTEMDERSTELSKQLTAYKGRGRGRGRHKGNKTSDNRGGGRGRSRSKVQSRVRGKGMRFRTVNTQQNLAEWYDSNESDIEIIEEPKVVIEINDQDHETENPAISRKSQDENQNPRCGEAELTHSTYLDYYCGLCAFKCQSSEILDDHMENHSLNMEISKREKAVENNYNKSILGSRYLTVQLEKLTFNSHVFSSKSLDVQNVGKRQNIAGSSAIESGLDINSLLEQAGLRTSTSSLRNLDRKNAEKISRQSLTNKDKSLLKTFNISEACVVLNHLKNPDIDSFLHKDEEETTDWLSSFNTNSTESDIDWDIPCIASNSLGDGYEADHDDNSDIIHVVENDSLGGKERKLLMEKVDMNDIDNNKPKEDTEFRTRALWSVISDKNKCTNGQKRKLRSNGETPPKVMKMQNGLEISESDSVTKAIRKKYGLQQAKVCLRKTDTLECKAKVYSKNYLKKCGIKDAHVCLSYLDNTQVGKQKLKRQDSSVFDISETSWWDDNKVKVKIDFRKTPIVLLKRIDLDNNEKVSASLSGSRPSQETTRGGVIDDSGVGRKLRSFKISITGNSKEMSRSLNSRSDKVNKVSHWQMLSKKKIHVKVESEAKLKTTTVKMYRLGNNKNDTKKLANPQEKSSISPRKKFVVKKKVFVSQNRTPMKKSTRIMDLETATKRKAHQEAISLIERTSKKKACSRSKQVLGNSRNIPVKNLTGHTDSKAASKRKIGKEIVSQKSKTHQRSAKHIFNIHKAQQSDSFEEKNEKFLRNIRKKHCEVKLQRLTVRDIKNWKQKEIDLEKKIKDQMIKLLTPEKPNAKIIVDRLTVENILPVDGSMQQMVAAASGMFEKDLTCELNIDTDFHQAVDENPQQIAKVILEEVVKKMFEGEKVVQSENELHHSVDSQKELVNSHILIEVDKKSVEESHNVSDIDSKLIAESFTGQLA